MSDIKTIGFVGTGIMGAPMARHLQKAGYDLRVYNRTKSKAQELIDNGAVWCDSPAETAEGADVIFTIVGFPPDVEDVILGDQGVLSKAKEGAIICDMTTSEPSLAEKIHAAAKEKGVGALDAPVSGGDTGAKQGTLAIMVGGDKEDFERVLPLFEIMGKTIKHIGPTGAGQHCKMVNQILIAGTMQGIAEALTYGKAAELDMETVLSVVSTGAAGSSCLTNLGPRVLEGDFEPGFIIEHFVKDMGIAIKEAKSNDLDLPALELGKQRYDKVIEEGMGRKGTQALAKSTAKANNVNM